MDWSSMTQCAWKTRDHAHAPYSQFFVGAAVVDAEGRIFGGCNVENLSFGLTICAERVAIASAIAAGSRSLSALVVVADTDTPISPCGACRQVMAEFGVTHVRLCNRHEFLDFSLDQLLPRSSAGILNRES
jgi:cytidine deaminase